MNSFSMKIPIKKKNTIQAIIITSAWVEGYRYFARLERKAKLTLSRKTKAIYEKKGKLQNCFQNNNILSSHYESEQDLSTYINNSDFPKHERRSKTKPYWRIFTNSGHHEWMCSACCAHGAWVGAEKTSIKCTPIPQESSKTFQDLASEQFSQKRHQMLRNWWYLAVFKLCIFQG